MKAIECVIRCHCEKGALFLSTLKAERQNDLPAMFWVTEDEKLFFRGVCNKCGADIMYTIPIMQLFMSVPGRRVL